MACMGEIRLFAFNYAPRDFQFCDGKMLTITNNEHLFSLLDNKYGGDAINTFALPDMRGRVPVGIGRGKELSKNWQLGEKFGEKYVRLTDGNLPFHIHRCKVSSDEGNTFKPGNNFLSSAIGEYKIYSSLKKPSEMVLMHSDSIRHTGENKPHYNMMPTMALNYCICTQGTDPREEDAEEEPLIGEIKIFANNFAPVGFKRCDGFVMRNNNDNQALFSLIGYIFGGTGHSFYLPDLQKRVISHRGKELSFTDKEGDIDGIVTRENMPSHNHYIQVSSKSGTESVMSANVVPAVSNTGDGRDMKIIDIYCNIEQKYSMMNLDMLSSCGNGNSHENQQPYLALNYYICVDGNFPTRS